MIATIAEDIRVELKNLHVVEAGFGAGPSFIGQHTHKYEIPTGMREGLHYLHRYIGTFKRARLKFENGKSMYFDRHEFNSYK